MDIERVRKELQKSALTEFPNAKRADCPDPETLGGMSRRIIRMTHSDLHHITHCSPCFQTFLAIRQQMRQNRVARIRITAAACAAVMALGAVVYWIVVVRPTTRGEVARPVPYLPVSHPRHKKGRR
jgi:hypothetical protein